MPSNNANGKTRGALAPRREPGRARVAALLEAAAAVIAAQGYDAATMAEIARRAGSPIGSLYRFFPGKEILAQALVQRYAALIGHAFDTLDAQVRTVPLDVLADRLLDFLVGLRGETVLMRALLEARAASSAQRLEFRKAALRRLQNTLLLRAPHLPRRDAKDVAVILLHNMKTMAALKFDPHVPTSPGAATELRRMNRLYLADRLGPGR